MLNLFSSHSWYVRETGSYWPIHTINVALSGPCVINMFLVVKLLIVLKLTPQFFTRFTHAHAHLYIRACYHCWRYWLTKKTGNLRFTSLYSINGDNICILFVWLQLGSLQTPAGSLTCSDTIRYKYTIWWYIWNCPLIERWFCSISMMLPTSDGEPFLFGNWAFNSLSMMLPTSDQYLSLGMPHSLLFKETAGKLTNVLKGNCRDCLNLRFLIKNNNNTCPIALIHALISRCMGKG